MVQDLPLVGFAVKSTHGKLTELLHASINTSIFVQSKRKDIIFQVFI